MPIPCLQMLRHLLVGGLLLTLATRSESPPNEHTTWPMPGGCERMVQALQTDWGHPFYHQATLSQTGILIHVHPILAGLLGLLWQFGTNPLFQLICWIVENSHPPSTGCVKSTASTSHPRCQMKREVISFYQPWPVCQLHGHFWTGVQTFIFKGDPPPGPHRAGWVHPSSGWYWWLYPPPGCIPRVDFCQGCLSLGSSW